MSFRPISTEGFKSAPVVIDMGPAPKLEWIDISDLVVDDSYQRPIARAGKTNIARIVSNFRWCYFAAVVVSPIEGGKYAIVDGQHRVTAAAILGITSVPCQLILADRKEQAAAFRAINGVQTAMTPLSLYHAEIVAGVKEALEIANCCECGGVTVVKVPKLATELKPGETLAINTLRQCRKTYGRNTLITALKCITETSANIPGAVSAVNVNAICWALNLKRAHCEAGGALLDAFDEIDLETLHDLAVERAKLEGVPRARFLAQLIHEALNERLDRYQLVAAHA